MYNNKVSFFFYKIKKFTYFPSGLNDTEMTASTCPSIVFEHRVTDRTLKRNTINLREFKWESK